MRTCAAMPGRCVAVLLLLGTGTLGGWAQQPGGSGDPTKPGEMRKIKFNARALPWPEVFRWLTKETGKPLVSSYTVALNGSFNIRVPDGATYTLGETIDLINNALIK